MRRRSSLILAIILVSNPVTTQAADASLRRAFVGFTGGIWLASTASAQITASGIVRSDLRSAFLGSALIGYHLCDELAFGSSLGVLAGKVRMQARHQDESQQSEFIVPILFWGRFYSHVHFIDSTVHPFIELSIGPCVGFVMKNDVESEVARSETAFGARLGGGIEKRIGETFVLSLNGALFLMTNYAAPIAGRRNFNGSEISVGFGILLGGGDGEGE